MVPIYKFSPPDEQYPAGSKNRCRKLFSADGVKVNVGLDRVLGERSKRRGDPISTENFLTIQCPKMQFGFTYVLYNVKENYSNFLTFFFTKVTNKGFLSLNW